MRKLEARTYREEKCVVARFPPRLIRTDSSVTRRIRRVPRKLAARHYRHLVYRKGEAVIAMQLRLSPNTLRNPRGCATIGHRDRCVPSLSGGRSPSSILDSRIPILIRVYIHTLPFTWTRRDASSTPRFESLVETLIVKSDTRVTFSLYASFFQHLEASLIDRRKEKTLDATLNWALHWTLRAALDW